MIEITLGVFLSSLVCSFCAGFVSCLSGFGAGIIFQVLWSLVYVFGGVQGTGNIKAANAILAWLTLALMLGLVFYEYCYYKTANFRKDIIVGFFPGDCLGIILGNFVLASVQSTTVRQTLGILFFILAVERIIHLFRASIPTYEIVIKTEDSPLLFGPSHLNINGNFESDQEKGYVNWFLTNKRTLIMSAITSIIAGILTGLFGIGGPPLMLLMSYLNLPKGEIRATSALINVLDSPLRIGAAIYFGIIHSGDWPLYIISTTAAMLGGVLGNFLHNKVKSFHIQFVLAALVLVAAGALLPAGSNSVLGQTLLGIYGFVLASIMLVYCYYRFTYPQPAPLVTLTKNENSSKSIIINYEPDKEGATLVTFSDLSGDDTEVEDKQEFNSAELLDSEIYS